MQKLTDSRNSVNSRFSKAFSANTVPDYQNCDSQSSSKLVMLSLFYISSTTSPSEQRVALSIICSTRIPSRKRWSSHIASLKLMVRADSDTFRDGIGSIASRHARHVSIDFLRCFSAAELHIFFSFEQHTYVAESWVTTYMVVYTVDQNLYPRPIHRLCG